MNLTTDCVTSLVGVDAEPSFCWLVSLGKVLVLVLKL